MWLGKRSRHRARMTLLGKPGWIYLIQKQFIVFITFSVRTKLQLITKLLVLNQIVVYRYGVLTAMIDEYSYYIE